MKKNDLITNISFAFSNYFVNPYNGLELDINEFIKEVRDIEIGLNGKEFRIISLSPQIDMVFDIESGNFLSANEYSMHRDDHITAIKMWFIFCDGRKQILDIFNEI